VTAVAVEKLALQRHTRWGVLLLLVPLLGFVLWAATANIAGAVIAPGKVAVESSVKRVQHKDGGIVSELLVAEGDRVQEGQVLARLDTTVIRANLQSIESQLRELSARQLRLEAERDGRAVLGAPSADLAGADLDRMMAAERNLLVTRRLSRQQKKAELQAEIGQSQREIEGLKAQAAAQVRQAVLIRNELAGLRRLYDQDYVPITRLDELEREAARLDGQKGEFEASASRAEGRIDELRIQVLQIDSDALAQAMSDLKDTEVKLAELTQQRATLQDQLKRAEIRSPRAGFVHQLAVHTVGGVVGPGETMMYVVPEHEALIVEVRVDPQHVDQVRAGGPAKVRFTSFSARSTPEIGAVVDRLAADATVDEKTGASYYLVELRIDPASLPADLRGHLIAGMPAEVHIQTQQRNALSYFLKPLQDQVSRSFKEG